MEQKDIPIPSLSASLKKLWLPILMTCVVLVGLFWWASGQQSLTTMLQKAQWQWLWAPALLVCFNMGLAAFRWAAIVKTAGYTMLWREGMYAILATWPLALLTPGRASDLLRPYIVRHRFPMAEGMSSVVVEKMIDVQSLCILVLVGSVWHGLWSWFAFALVGLICAWGGVALLLYTSLLEWIKARPYLNKFSKLFDQFFSIFEHFRAQPLRFVYVCSLSLLAWCVALLIIWSLLHIFGAPLPVSHVVSLWPIALFIGQLPITFAGMGTRDASFLALIMLTSPQNVPQAGILSATFSYALLTTWMPAVLGLPWSFRFLATYRQQRQGKEEPNT